MPNTARMTVYRNRLPAVIVFSGLIAVILLWLAGTGPVIAYEGHPRAMPGDAETLRLLTEAAHASPLIRTVIYTLTMLFPLGVLLDIQFVYHRIRYGAATRLRIDDVSWGYLDIFIVITVFILALFSLAVLYPGISKMFPPGEKTLLPVVFHFIAELVALAFLFRLISVRCHRIARPLKLIPYELVDQILFGIRCYIGFLPLLLILNWLTEWIANLWGIKLLPQEQIGLFFADASLPLLVFFTAFVAFFGPLIEELFFRGFTYQALRIKFGKWTSILVTATLFSLLHTNLAAFIPILGLGILLAYAFEWSGSLIPSIVIHICHNSVSVAVVLLIRSL